MGDTWEHDYGSRGIVIAVDVPCGLPDPHYMLSSDGKVRVCSGCAGHGVVKWASVRSVGLFFYNAAIGVYLGAAAEAGKEAGYWEGYNDRDLEEEMR